MVDFSKLTKRGKAIEALREHARSFDNPVEGHRALTQIMDALLQEWRKEHDIPGTRYWEVYHQDGLGTRSHFSACLNTERAHWQPPNVTLVELTRVEYLARQGIIDYDKDSL